MARPMPRPAPVTIATFSLSLMSLLIGRRWHRLLLFEGPENQRSGDVHRRGHGEHRRKRIARHQQSDQRLKQSAAQTAGGPHDAEYGTDGILRNDIGDH